MLLKAWNVRDQTNETLKAMLEHKYKEINSSYKMLKRLSKLEDAKKMLDSIWALKALCSDIELELLRRETTVE